MEARTGGAAGPAPLPLLTPSGLATVGAGMNPGLRPAGRRRARGLAIRPGALLADGLEGIPRGIEGLT